MQHIVHHLAPGGEGEIRRALIEVDLVDCMIALPGQLFFTKQIPVCLWFLSRNKATGALRDRRGSTLFIDARKLGALVDRTHREFPDAEIARVSGTYHAWRSKAGNYVDEPSFCKAATTAEIAANGYVLTPGRYVGAAEAEPDAEPLDAKMARLTATLKAQFAEVARLEQMIAENLARLEFEL